MTTEAKSSAKTGTRKTAAVAPKSVAEKAKVAPPTVFGPATATLLGEVITWNVTGAVAYADLVAAIKSAGLDESVARELAPRHAFTRACKQLSDERIIRQTDDDGATITFQFTRESKVGDQYEYAIETMLTLDKKTGKVACEIGALEEKAQVALDKCIEVRTAGDVTTCIQKLFDRNADLFRIRPQGGAYFVPERFRGFLEQIQVFMTAVNGTLLRFPIPVGTPHGDRSVRDAVADGLNDAIAEHRAAVAEFGSDTRDATFERAAEKIRETRYKVETYAEYLGDQRARLDAALAESAVGLRKRIEAIASMEPVFFAESAEVWAKGDTDELAVEELMRIGEYPAGAVVAYKVWKVHPDTTMNAAGKFLSPAVAAKPEFVREVEIVSAAAVKVTLVASEPKPAAPKPDLKPAAPKPAPVTVPSDDDEPTLW